MRQLADADRIRWFMRALGREASSEVRCYFTGGATAVLLGWRRSTIDVDLKLVPEADEVLRAIPRLKEELRINVELASPLDFIPVPRPVGRTAVCSSPGRGGFRTITSTPTPRSWRSSSAATLRTCKMSATWCAADSSSPPVRWSTSSGLCPSCTATPRWTLGRSAGPWRTRSAGPSSAFSRSPAGAAPGPTR